MKHILAVCVALVFLAALMGCTGYGYPSTPSIPVTPGPAVSPTGNAVTIANYSFSPPELQVSRGTSVTWTNKDSVDHTVSSNSGVFESGSLSSGGSFSYTFNEAGVFEYYCGLHPGMSGKIIVQ